MSRSGSSSPPAPSRNKLSSQTAVFTHCTVFISLFRHDEQLIWLFIVLFRAEKVGACATRGRIFSALLRECCLSICKLLPAQLSHKIIQKSLAHGRDTPTFSALCPGDVLPFDTGQGRCPCTPAGMTSPHPLLLYNIAPKAAALPAAFGALIIKVWGCGGIIPPQTKKKTEPCGGSVS